MSDITDTINKVNRGIKAMQFIAGHAHIFTNGFNYTPWNARIDTWIYPSYDDNGDEIENSAKATMAAAIREVRQAMPGAATAKSYTDYDFVTTVTGSDFTICLRTSRTKVCERVIVGTTMVEEKDYNAAPTKMVEREVVEWRCDSILESA